MGWVNLLLFDLDGLEGEFNLGILETAMKSLMKMERNILLKKLVTFIYTKSILARLIDNID